MLIKLPSLLLQGTLAKRTKPTLQPNFAKEPPSPSRYIARIDSTEINDYKYRDEKRPAYN